VSEYLERPGGLQRAVWETGARDDCRTLATETAGLVRDLAVRGAFDRSSGGHGAVSAGFWKDLVNGALALSDGGRTGDRPAEDLGVPSRVRPPAGEVSIT
jgi:hypothetical protein